MSNPTQKRKAIITLKDLEAVQVKEGTVPLTPEQEEAAANAAALVERELADQRARAEEEQRRVAAEEAETQRRLTEARNKALAEAQARQKRNRVALGVGVAFVLIGGGMLGFRMLTASPLLPANYEQVAPAINDYPSEPVAVGFEAPAPVPVAPAVEAVSPPVSRANAGGTPRPGKRRGRGDLF